MLFVLIKKANLLTFHIDYYFLKCHKFFFFILSLRYCFTFICIFTLFSLLYNLFPPHCLSPVSYLCCSGGQGKVPHRDSESPLRPSEGLAPRPVCPFPQYQILSDILDAMGCGAGPEPASDRDAAVMTGQRRRRR